MPCTLRDYIWHLSSGTIARMIGSPKYVDIDRAFEKVCEKIADRADSYSWTVPEVWAMFKEAAA